MADRKIAKRAPSRSRRLTPKLRAERGISPLLIVVIIAVIALGAGGFIFMSSKNGTPLASSLPGVGNMAGSANCPSTDKVLCKFFLNTKEPKDTRMTSTTLNPGGTKMETVMETSGKTKSHFVTKENGKDMMESISIDDTSYLKDYTDGKWFKMTSPKETSQIKEEASKFDVVDKIPTGTQEEDTSQNFKALGKEACGNLMCYKYQMIAKDQIDEEYIWFDDKDYLMRRTLFISKDGTKNDASWDYKSVSVTAPTNVKEYPKMDGGAGIPGLNPNDAKDLQNSIQKMQKNVPTDEPASPDDSDSSY